MSKVSVSVKDVIAEQKTKGIGKSNSFSRGELDQLAQAMINDEDYEVPVYVRKGDSYGIVKEKPGQKVRDTIFAPLLKTAGLDRTEVTKLAQEYQVSRSGGEAMASFALHLTKAYLTERGRKLTLPATGEAEAIMTIVPKLVPEKSVDTNVIVKGEDGQYTTSPTGKTVVTKEHVKGVMTNRVPVWLKKTVTTGKK